MSTIQSIKAREILDSRGYPTIEVDVKTKDGLFRGSVPSGASTGIHEALELRDNDKARFNGKGVLEAVEHVNTLIEERIVGMDASNQKDLDIALVNLDGTSNKSNLGANSLLAVSIAVCRAGAFAKKIPLYKHVSEIAGVINNHFIMPVPCFNVINGGKHAGNNLPIQEFMIIPTGAYSFKEALMMGSDVYHKLKEIINEKYGHNEINVGDEGGFAPNLDDNKEALTLITDAIKKSGYKSKIRIGIDVAASEFFIDNKYDLGFKKTQKKSFLKKRDEIPKNSEEMIKLYKEYIDEFDIMSIEDPFAQDEWKIFSEFTSKFGNKIQIVGDDLLVTNQKRIEQGILNKSCNCLLLKPNQIGTVTEAIEAFNTAKNAGWNVMVSNRSGETEDSFIADLAVGLSASQIKSGAPCRSERLAKYNQLLRIEEELGSECGYAGHDLGF